MKLFREAIIIFGIYLLGVFLVDVFNLPLPGNVLGMVILFLLLCFKVIKVEQIKTTANFFLDHLAFFFIPAGVGLISSFDVIKFIWIQLLIVCLITTIVTMVTTGKIVQMISKVKERDKNGECN